MGNETKPVRDIEPPILVFPDKQGGIGINIATASITVQETENPIPAPTAAELLRKAVQAATENANPTTTDDWAKSGSCD